MNQHLASRPSDARIAAICWVYLFFVIVSRSPIFPLCGLEIPGANAAAEDPSLWPSDRGYSSVPDKSLERRRESIERHVQAAARAALSSTVRPLSKPHFENRGIYVLFIIIERFRDNDMIPIYQRVRDGWPLHSGRTQVRR